MPRVYTKKAAKDYPQHGIAKGDVYYEWAFYRQRPRKSKTYPKPSQLTNVESESEMLAAYETDRIEGPEDVRDIISALESAREQEQEKFDNMPEGFQQGESGQRIEAHVSALDDAISSLETIESEWQEYLDLSPEEAAEAADDRDWEAEVRETQPDWE